MIDYFMQNIWLIWVLVSLLCLILELGSGDLFILSFSVGALCAAVATGLGAGVVVQIIVFVVFSLLCVFYLRPIAKQYLHRNTENRLSNADALPGRTGTVSQAIAAGGYGRVAVDGDDWKAVSADGTAIAKGERVRIVKLDSIIVTVERV
jgi:membrane protein implicated in regulation of membrane protease activity